MIQTGDQSSGDFSNNQEEGFDGYTINMIAGACKNALNLQPNVVLIHAGTNDMNDSPPPDPYDEAPDRLGALIDEVLCTCPNATLIVAQIITSTNAGVQPRIDTYNAAIPDVVAERAGKGFKVLTVDMSSIKDLKDGLHPTDSGYNQMATFWAQALQQASDNGWITAPDPETSAHGGGGQKCDSGLFWYPANDGKAIASGVGSGGNAHFTNDWVPFSKAASG